MYAHKQTATSLGVVLIAHGPGPVCVCVCVRVCVYTSMAFKSLAPSVQCKLDARRVRLLVGIRHTSLFITIRVPFSTYFCLRFFLLIATRKVPKF